MQIDENYCDFEINISDFIVDKILTVKLKQTVVK